MTMRGFTVLQFFKGGVADLTEQVISCSVTSLTQHGVNMVSYFSKIFP